MEAVPAQHKRRLDRLPLVDLPLRVAVLRAKARSKGFPVCFHGRQDYGAAGARVGPGYGVAGF